MITDTVLMDAEIFDCFDSQCAEIVINFDADDLYPVGRAIEQAVLQSPDIQERIRDGERLEWLAENINEIEVYRSQRGWCVVEKGTTRSIVEDCKTLRGALDAAMEKQK